MSQSLRLLTGLLLIITILTTPTLYANQAYWEYTFRPGDTIWKLAKTYTTSVNNWLAIQKINHIASGPDRRIKPGTRIKIPVSMLKTQPAPALVIATSAKVRLIHANQSSQLLAVNDRLYSGDTIITQANQFVSLRFADSSELTILPDSTVSMDRLSQFKQTGMIDTQIHLQSGHIDTRVHKQAPGSHYKIVTPSAVTAVRGTKFRVSAQTQQLTRTEVTRGKVAVSADHSSQLVKSGYGVIAEKGKPITPPIKLLAAPVAKFTAAQQLQWQALNGAQSYRYQLASDTDFTHILNQTLTTALSINMSSLPEGHYAVRLRGIDKNQLEGLNTQLAVTIKHRPPPEKKADNSIWPVFVPIGIFLLGL